MNLDVVSLREESLAKQRNVQSVTLRPVSGPTVIVVSGLLGSGKTSLLEKIIGQTEMPSELKAAIFNEKFEALAKLDASKVREIETATLGGCACCLSNQELKNTVKRFFDQGRKLIVIEQSGVTDGAQLRRSVENEFGSIAYVRLLSVVDAGHLKAPPAILHSSIMAADAVFLSHVSGDSKREEVAKAFVSNLRKDRGVDFVQSGAGDISGEAWEKLLRGTVAPSGGLTILTENVPQITPEQELARRTIRDRMMATVLMLNPSVSTSEIKELISSCPLRLSRAKGWMQSEAGNREVQYEQTDNGGGVIAFGDPTHELPLLFEGRPHLFLLSTEGIPPSDHFISIGIPNFSPSEVEYSIKHYPSKESLEHSLTSGQGIPIGADGDALVLQAFRLAKKLGSDRSLTLPEETKLEFDQAFFQLTKQYVEWRVDVADLIRREPRAGVGVDYGERCAKLGYSLMWTLCSFGGLLNHPQVNVMAAALTTQPAHLLFEGLRDSKRLEINDSPLMTSAIVNDLAAFTYVGLNKLNPPVSKELVSAAIKNLEALVHADSEQNKTEPEDEARRKTWQEGFASLRELLSKHNISI